MAYQLTPTREDPFSWYQAMRERTPIHHQPEGGYWEVFGYDQVKLVLSRYHDFSSDFRAFWARTDQNPPRGALFGESLIRLDPPEHTPLRQLVNPAFNALSMERLRPTVRQIADGYLQKLDPQEMDFVRDFAFPFPVTVISELLGVPASDRDRFKRWVDTLIPLGASDPFRFRRPWLQDSARQAVREEMEEYFDYFLDLRRREPQQDLMTLLVQGGIDGHPLTHEQIFQFCVLLLIAGHVTTTNLLANGALWLALHPQAFDRLREQGGRFIRPFVEEVLRFWSPVQRISRYTLHPVALDGVEIPANVSGGGLGGVGQPRPQRVPPTRPISPRPASQSPYRLWVWGAHLLGRPAGASGGGNRLGSVAPPFWGWELTTPIEAPALGGILYGLARLPLRAEAALG